MADAVFGPKAIAVIRRICGLGLSYKDGNIKRDGFLFSWHVPAAMGPICQRDGDPRPWGEAQIVKPRRSLTRLRHGVRQQDQRTRAAVLRWKSIATNDIVGTIVD